ncbi:UNVERIFIED_ORG: hypothetical protein EOZ59_1689 [Serratia quinivorans]|nr:Uncharacterised protein [Serratia grimesii]
MAVYQDALTERCVLIWNNKKGFCDVVTWLSARQILCSLHTQDICGLLRVECQLNQH